MSEINRNHYGEVLDETALLKMLEQENEEKRVLGEENVAKIEDISSEALRETLDGMQKSDESEFRQA